MTWIWLTNFISCNGTNNTKLAHIYTHTYIYIYIYIHWPLASSPGDWDSTPGHVITKTLKMVLDTSLLNTQHYKVCIIGKVEQSRERSYWKRSLLVTLDYGCQLDFYLYVCVYVWVSIISIKDEIFSNTEEHFCLGSEFLCTMLNSIWSKHWNSQKKKKKKLWRSPVSLLICIPQKIYSENQNWLQRGIEEIWLIFKTFIMKNRLYYAGIWLQHILR